MYSRMHHSFIAKQLWTFKFYRSILCFGRWCRNKKTALTIFFNLMYKFLTCLLEYISYSLQENLLKSKFCSLILSLSNPHFEINAMDVVWLLLTRFLWIFFMHHYLSPFFSWILFQEIIYFT